MLRVRYEHVRGQTVTEGTDFASGPTGRRLPRERECAAAGLAVLAEQEMHGIDLFIHPNTALMLIDAHAPEAQHLAFFFADEIGKLHELLLEGVDRLVVVSFGEFGNEVKRVRFERLA